MQQEESQIDQVSLDGAEETQTGEPVSEEESVSESEVIPTEESSSEVVVEESSEAVIENSEATEETTSEMASEESDEVITESSTETEGAMEDIITEESVSEEDSVTEEESITTEDKVTEEETESETEIKVENTKKPNTIKKGVLQSKKATSQKLVLASVDEADLAEALEEAKEYIDALTINNTANDPATVVSNFKTHFTWDNEKRENSKSYLFDWSYYNGVVFEGLEYVYEVLGESVYADYVIEEAVNYSVSMGIKSFR